MKPTQKKELCERTYFFVFKHSNGIEERKHLHFDFDKFVIYEINYNKI